jgi:hypothetical protein
LSGCGETPRHHLYLMGSHLGVSFINSQQLLLSWPSTRVIQPWAGAAWRTRVAGA